MTTAPGTSPSRPVLLARAGVDQEGAGLHGRPRLGRVEPLIARLGGGQHVVERHDDRPATRRGRRRPGRPAEHGQSLVQRGELAGGRPRRLVEQRLQRDAVDLGDEPLGQPDGLRSSDRVAVFDQAGDVGPEGSAGVALHGSHASSLAASEQKARVTSQCRRPSSPSGSACAGRPAPRGRRPRSRLGVPPGVGRAMPAASAGAARGLSVK